MVKKADLLADPETTRIEETDHDNNHTSLLHARALENVLVFELESIQRNDCN